MPGNFSLLYTESAGNTILASRRNAEFQNIIDKFEPQYMEDYSANTTEMRATEDPGESGSESLASSLQGELTRLRHAILETKQKIDPSLTYWYETPTTQAAVTGPSASTDNAIARFNGTGGSQVQNTRVTISDLDVLTIGTSTLTTSSSSTTFSSTTVADASAWDLSAVLAGDIAVASGGSYGTVSSADDGTDTVTVASWTGGTPSNGETVDIERRGRLSLANPITDQVKLGDGTGTGTDPDLLINNDTGDATIRLQVNNNSAAAWDIKNDNSQSDDLYLNFGGSDHLTITSELSPDPIIIRPLNITSSTTPADNTLYPNTIAKAWAYTDSGGTLQDGVNLSVSKTGTGQYTYTFRNVLASANFAGVASVAVVANLTAQVIQVSASQFNVITRNPSTGGTVDAAHSVIIFGEQ